MKKDKIYFEDIEIPKILEEDVLKTIECSKQILRNHKTIKKESNTWLAIRKVIFIYGCKSIVFQGGLALFLLIFGWFIMPNTSMHFAMALLWMGGLIMSLAIGTELIRSDIYQMTELEQTCMFSPQRLLIWKMGLLSAISIVGLFLIAWIMSQKSDLNLYTLLCGGGIPFFLLTTITLQLRQKENILSNFIFLYTFALGVLIVMSVNNGNQFLSFFNTFGSVGFVISIIYCVYVVYHANKWGY